MLGWEQEHKESVKQKSRKKWSEITVDKSDNESEFKGKEVEDEIKSISIY